MQSLSKVLCCILVVINGVCNGGAMDYQFFKTGNGNNRVIDKPATYFTATDGVALAYFYHEAAGANDQSPVLIFYHGGGAYQVPAYQQMAQELAQNNTMSSYLFDIRGHGLSGGARGDAPSVDRVLLDVQEAIAFVREQHPQAPVYLAGHSSGCGLLMHALQQKYIPADMAGMIFISPFLGSSSKLVLKNNFIKKVSVWRFMWHGITGYGLNKPAVYFNYPDWLQEQAPLLLDYYTVAMALAITSEHGDDCLKKFPLPLHIIIGSNDQQINAPLLSDWCKQGMLAPTTKVTVCQDKGHFSILAAAATIIANPQQ